jgi:hypothetical protein
MVWFLRIPEKGINVKVNMGGLKGSLSIAGMPFCS